MTRWRAVVLAVVLSLPFGFVGGYLLHRWTNQWEERFESCVVLVEEAMKRSGEDRLDRRKWSRLREDRIRECVTTSR
jgi:hypothetical protein